MGAITRFDREIEIKVVYNEKYAEKNINSIDISMYSMEYNLIL